MRYVVYRQDSYPPFRETVLRILDTKKEALVYLANSLYDSVYYKPPTRKTTTELEQMSEEALYNLCDVLSDHLGEGGSPPNMKVIN